RLAGDEQIKRAAAAAVGLIHHALPALQSGARIPASYWQPSKNLAEQLYAGNSVDDAAIASIERQIPDNSPLADADLAPTAEETQADELTPPKAEPVEELDARSPEPELSASDVEKSELEIDSTSVATSDAEHELLLPKADSSELPALDAADDRDINDPQLNEVASDQTEPEPFDADDGAARHDPDHVTGTDAAGTDFSDEKLEDTLDQWSAQSDKISDDKTVDNEMQSAESPAPVDLSRSDSPEPEAELAPKEEPKREATPELDEAPEPEEMASEPEVEEQPVIADPVLRDIFNQEITGYINELEERLAQAEQNGEGLECDHSLTRLLHTALGSARTTGVDDIARLARYLEDWVALLSDHQLSIPKADMPLFSRGIQALRELSAWAVDPARAKPPIESLEAELKAHTRQVHQDYEAGLLTPAEATKSSDDSDLADTSWSDGEKDTDKQQPAALPSSTSEDADSAQESQKAVGTESSPAEDRAEMPPQPADKATGEDAFDLEHRPDDDPSEQDPDILQIFVEEADELLAQADDYLSHWQAHPQDVDTIRQLHRNLHTLKGGARMAGLLNLGDIAHQLESRLLHAQKEGVADVAGLIAIVQQAYDVIGSLIDRVRMGDPIPQQRQLLARIQGETSSGAVLSAHVEDEAAAADGSKKTSHQPPAKSQPEADKPTKKPSANQKTSPSSGADQRRDELIRVSASGVDQMVSQIGESMLLQSRIDRQIKSSERQLFELQQTVNRLRGQLRRLEIETETQIKADLLEETGLSEEEFDPLEFDRFTQVQELSRGVMESLGDIASIEQSLSSSTEQSQLLLLEQSRLCRKMQDGAMSMRLVRFSEIVPRLRRIVRQVGNELGHQAELVIENGDTEIDRVMLTSLLPALEHMLRNSLAHGIEPLVERKQAGKPTIGEVCIRIESDGGNISIEVRDDGRGLDLDELRRKGIERGLVPDDMEISDDEARQLIFAPGFSTADKISQVAGRGVGLDVVTAGVRELGGFVDIDSEQGKYTAIRLNLPLTQVMTRGILVTAGDERYAIPYKGLVAITRLTGVELNEQYQQSRPTVSHNGELYSLYYLGSILWGRQPIEAAEVTEVVRPILLFKLGERRFAIQCDQQLGGIQLFVKSLGVQLGRLPGLSGATIADDGDVILVLELFELVRQYQRRDYQRFMRQSLPEVRRSKPLVLVVDDSLTVRKVTASTLERNQYDVVLARDGVEALGALQEQTPDLVLTDIEMPRMDGFELLGAIRNDAGFADVPVVMISSRTGQKHRIRARDLGVSAYLGKPYTEGDLVNVIEQLLPKSRSGSKQHNA
ncbi:MAG TPA: response regulator, partial [Halothiobacillaceae bacterium]|nr:response regulator [Halothiobacillaceae bacterium]